MNQIVVYGTRVGGISGYAQIGSNIENCYNKAMVIGITSTTTTGASSCVGGITSMGYGTITNCYNMGNVKGTGNVSVVGGLCAQVRDVSVLNNSYNIGNVLITECTTKYYGGLVGRNGTNATTYKPITINNCYCTSKPTSYKYNTSTNQYVAQNSKYVDGDILKTYASTLGDAFVDDITPNINNGYPILRWQLTGE